MQMKHRLIIGSIFFTLILASCGVEVGKMESHNTSIDLQTEKALDVSIRLGAGDLTINGETEKAAEVNFSYNIEKLKPIVDYKISEQNVGLLTISQSNMNVPIGNVKGLEYNGDVRLNNSIPLNLNVKTGAGNNTLDLHALNLQKAEVISGVGQTKINLNGDYKKGFDVIIESGVGQTEIIVPKNVGVKVTLDNGIGQIDTIGLLAEDKSTYVNHAYGKSKVTVNMKIKMGVGDVEIIEGEATK